METLMALTEEQRSQLYVFFVKANILDVLEYNPTTCVTNYSRLNLEGDDDDVFNYVFSYLSPLQLSKTYDFIIGDRRIDIGFNKPENIEKLLFGIFSRFNTTQFSAIDKNNFEDWLSSLSKKYHPAASAFVQANEKWKAAVALKAALKKELEPEDFYPYANANRFHLFTVEYAGKKGDQAKTAILSKLSQEISRCESKESLAEFKATTMSPQSEEYKLLKTGTGFFTHVFGLKTDSEVALEKMFAVAESWVC